MSEGTSTEETRTYRLGDDVDDYCSRCRALSTHAISALLDGDVLKVVCRCLFEHKYRHGKSGRKSKEAERQKLFDDVLKNSPFRPK